MPSFTPNPQQPEGASVIDFDEALAATARPKGPKCQLCKLIGSLDDVQRAKVEAALASDLQQARIARALSAMTGDTIWESRGQMVASHRQHMR